MEKHGHQQRGRVNEQVVVERVRLGVVAQAVWLLHSNEVDDIGGRSQEQDFEQGVI